MKLAFTTIFLLCILSFSIQAQQITVDPVNYIENFDNVNITNAGLDLEAHIAVKNNNADTIKLIWTRIVTENCPVEWQTQICDNNLCYWFTVSTNVSEDGPNAPFELAGQESFDDFILHVFPNTVPGCCRVKVDFATIQEPDVVLETAIFDVSVNTPECDFSSSTYEINEAQLVSLFPNPTSDGFTLSNNDVVKQVDVYNTLGQKLRSFDFQNGEYMNVEDLDAGLYSLVLKNAKGEALHSLMLDKI